MALFFFLLTFLCHSNAFDLILDHLNKQENAFFSYNLAEIIKKQETNKNYSIMLQNGGFFLEIPCEINNILILYGENARITIQNKGSFIVNGKLSFFKIDFSFNLNNVQVFELRGILLFNVKKKLNFRF
jgi:hypothetical protein